MDPVDYLRGIKGRWRLIALVVVVAMAGAWGSTLIGRLAGGKKTYTASVSLLPGGGASSSSKTTSRSGSQQGTTLDTIAALATVDQVVQRVATKINYSGDLAGLGKKVLAKVDQKSNLLKVSALAANPDRAKLIANTFAAELLGYLIDRERASNAAEAAALRQQIKRVQGDIANIDKQLKKYPGVVIPTTTTSTSGSRSGATGGSSRSSGQAPSPADPLLAQRTAALSELGSLSSQLQEVQARVPNAEGLSIVQAATLTGGGKSGFGLPSSLIARLLIALVLGLLFGAALALLRERMDRRIRTKAAAERHFGYPVLVEIPSARKRRNGDAPKAPDLAPQVADAFRLLGAGINGAYRDNGNGARTEKSRPRTILVTSAGPAEGKTSVVANLAATLGEVGKTVLVLSCDFRHPEVHEEFGIPNERGLAEALATSNGGPVLYSCIWYTSVSGVWVVPSGTAGQTPEHLLSSAGMRRALQEARSRSDVVLVDTSPIMTSDLTFLLPQVDGVLVVARAGETKPHLAERSSEILKRLEAPVLGVVLTGDAAVSLPRGYYRNKPTWRMILGSPVVAVRGLWRGVKATGRGVRRAGGRLRHPVKGGGNRGGGNPRVSRPTGAE
jgi:capsular exopolysaccharide synthesis family protein